MFFAKRYNLIDNKKLNTTQQHRKHHQTKNGIFDNTIVIKCQNVLMVLRAIEITFLPTVANIFTFRHIVLAKSYTDVPGEFSKANAQR